MASRPLLVQEGGVGLLSRVLALCLALTLLVSSSRTLPALAFATELSTSDNATAVSSLPPFDSPLLSLPRAPPRILAVSGCALTLGNATLGCVPSAYNLTIHGRLFTPSSYVYVAGALAQLLLFVSPTEMVTSVPPFSFPPGGVAVLHVFNDAQSSDVVGLVSYASTLAQVDRVAGCPTASGAGTADCQPGFLLLLYGQRFPYSAAISVGGSSCASVQRYNASCMACTLPALPRSSQLIPQVLTIVALDIRWSVTTAPLVSYSLPGPRVLRVSGCPIDVPASNSTADCLRGTVVTVTGLNFLAPVTAYVQSTTYPCRNVQLLSSSQLTCELPLPHPLGGVFSLVVNAAGLTSNAFPIDYVSLRPVLLRVLGCAAYDPSTNSSSGCLAGQHITVQGSGFRDVTAVHVGRAECLRVEVQSTVQLTFQLPPQSSQLWGQSMYVSLNTAWNQGSQSFATLSYAFPGPLLVSVSGCARTLGNATAGCDGGQTVLLTGRNFTRRMTLAIGYEQLQANVTYVSPLQATAVLPYVRAYQPTVQTLQLLSGGQYSNAPALITYDSQLPLVWRVTGCTQDNATDNSTRGCTAGTRVTVEGSKFFNVDLQALVGGHLCADLHWESTARFTCALPPYPSTRGDEPQVLGVAAGGLTSTFQDARWVFYRWDGPVIHRLRGCDVAGPGEGTSACTGGEVLTVTGAAFTVAISQVVLDSSFRSLACLSPTVVSAFELRCTLPEYQTSGANFTLTLVSGGVSATNRSLVLNYGPVLPRVWQVKGCAFDDPTNNSTSGCLPGTRISLATDAEPFSVTVDGLPCTYVQFLAPRNFSCTLPFIAASRQGLRLPVQLVTIGSLLSTPACLVSYPVDAPDVWGVTGCPAELWRNGTGDCQGGAVVTVTGARFNVSGQVSASLVNSASFRYPCTDIVVLSPSLLTCRLPYLSSSGSYNPYQMQVSGRYSNAVGPGSVVYAPQQPLVWRVTGCAFDNVTGNSTSECVAGQTVTVYGAQLNGPRVAWLRDARQSRLWRIDAVTSLDSSALTVVLPVIGQVDFQGQPLSLSVITANGQSSPDRPLVSYAVVGPVISSAQGCAVDGPGNGTSECLVDSTLLLYGVRFPPDAQVYVGYPGTPATDVHWYNPLSLSCRLPWTPAVNWGQPVAVWLSSAGGNVTSNSQPIRFHFFGPVIARVDGCPLFFPDANTTGDCVGGELLSITGVNFTDAGLAVSLSMSVRCLDVAFHSPSLVTCRLPVVSTLGGTTFALQLTSGGVTSPSVTISYASRIPTVWGVTGCVDDPVHNSTADCLAEQRISVWGQRFINASTVSVSSQGFSSYSAQCTAVVLHSPQQLSCALPAMPSTFWEQPLLVAVQGPGQASSQSVPLVRYAWVGPYVTGVSGCRAFNASDHSTAGCSGGQLVTIQGRSFALIVSVTVGNVGATDVTRISSGLITAALPYLPLTVPGIREVMVWNRDDGQGRYSNRAPLVGYDSQQPLVWSASGCGIDWANTSSGCQAGDTVTVTGAQFLNGSLSVAVRGRSLWYNCTDVHLLSSSLLTCALPLVVADDMEATLSLQVFSSGLTNTVAYLLAYAYLGPYIHAVRGCALEAGLGTADCNGGDAITLTGRNFTRPRLAVYVDGAVCAEPVAVSHTQVTCRLPYLPSYGGAVGVQVYSGGELSNTARLVSYASQQPAVWRVTGCAQDNATDNSTSVCRRATRVTIAGARFYAVDAVYVGDSRCVDVAVMDASRLTCGLPAQSLEDEVGVMAVFVLSSGLYSPPRWLVAYDYEGPVISAVYGCAEDNHGCSSGDRLTIAGSGFAEEEGLQVRLSAWPRDYLCAVEEWSPTELVVRLPYIPLQTPTDFTLRVASRGQVAVSPVVVGYDSQEPRVWRVQGCLDDRSTRGTGNCTRGQLVTVLGRRFVPPPLRVVVAGYEARVLEINSSALLVALPALPPELLSLPLYLQVQTPLLFSPAYFLLSYANVTAPWPLTQSSSSSSSTPSSSPSFSSSSSPSSSPSLSSAASSASSTPVAPPTSSSASAPPCSSSSASTASSSPSSSGGVKASSSSSGGSGDCTGPNCGSGAERGRLLEVSLLVAGATVLAVTLLAVVGWSWRKGRCARGRSSQIEWGSELLLSLAPVQLADTSR